MHAARRVALDCIKSNYRKAGRGRQAGRQPGRQAARQAARQAGRNGTAGAGCCRASSAKYVTLVGRGSGGGAGGQQILKIKIDVT